jgi:hydroxymethylbilane synthase
LRRRAQLLRRRPDLAITPIRGNVNTRLAKLDAGEVDALMVAMCGLERLGSAEVATEILPPEIMLPAVAQGALAIECREDDERIRALLTPLHDEPSASRVLCERAMLAALDGSCRTPIAGLAEITGERISLRALLLSPDGRTERRAKRDALVTDAAKLGNEIGEELRKDAGPEFGLP